MTARLNYWRSLAPLAIAALFAAQIAIRFASDLNHDTAWYLYVAAGLLDGKELYRDFVEVNPPLAMWLTVPVPWAARLLGFDAVPVFYATFLLLTGLALVAAWRYAGLIPQLAGGGRLALLVVTAAILLFAPGGNFGQREQLIVLFFLPWLLLRVARVEGAKAGSWERAAVGIVAAAGICMKPHSVLAPLAVEVVLLLRHRHWRLLFAAENLAATGFAAIYVAAVLVLTPAYFTAMVELGVKAYMPFYGGDAGFIIVGSLPCIAALVIAVAMIGLADGSKDRALPLAMLAAALGFLISFFVQNKGYSYQLLPAQTFAALAAAAAFIVIVPAGRIPFAGRLLAAVLAGVVLALNYRPQTYVSQGAGFELLIDKYRPQARSIFIATTNVYKGFPLATERGFVWASRFPAQWLAPYVGSKWQDGPLPGDAIVAYALDAAVGDLAQFRPDIVLVDVSRQQTYVPGAHFDYVKFWSNDPRFAAVWKDYELRGTQDGYEIYTLKD
jgi:hypothetical protein